MSWNTQDGSESDKGRKERDKWSYLKRIYSRKGTLKGVVQDPSVQGAATRELPTRTQRTTERKLLEPGTKDSLERTYSEGARTFGGKHNHRQVVGMKGDPTPSSAFVTPRSSECFPLAMSTKSKVIYRRQLYQQDPTPIQGRALTHDVNNLKHSHQKPRGETPKAQLYCPHAESHDDEQPL